MRDMPPVTPAERLIYLDNNATTRCAPEVVRKMLPFFDKSYGNASSPHRLGREAAKAVAAARGNISSALGCEESDIYFTSGATEANNIVLQGIFQKESPRKKIVISAIEHKSITECAKILARSGIQVATLPVTKAGIVDIAAAKSLIDENTLLVSVQGANNEIGTIQPIQEISDIAHSKGALLHCDSVQLLGKVSVNLSALNADFYSFSAHKIYGPKGVGFLVAKPSRTNLLSAILGGGGQERGLRPGTLNIPAIVGAGEACRISAAYLPKESIRIAKLRTMFEEGISKLRIKNTIVSVGSRRIPGTTSVIFHGIPSDLLIAQTPNICMSIGSACNMGSITPSHVLLALGINTDEARSVIRFSFGRYNTTQDVKLALKYLRESFERITLIP